MSQLSSILALGSSRSQFTSRMAPCPSGPHVHVAWSGGEKKQGWGCQPSPSPPHPMVVPGGLPLPFFIPYQAASCSQPRCGWCRRPARPLQGEGCWVGGGGGGKAHIPTMIWGCPPATYPRR